MQKVYFHNLNSLRFFAALIIIICHQIQINGFYGLYMYPVFKNPLTGKLGVILFFVLSGFLITYLLLMEQFQTKTISIKDFYLRRIFRIWPLYYFLLFLVFIVLRVIPFFDIPGINGDFSLGNFALFFFMLSNVALNFKGIVPYISQTWSISVEEQFYLIWPVAMKYIKNKVVLLLSSILIFLIIGYIVLPLFTYILNSYTSHLFTLMWKYSFFDCMPIGGIFAYIYYKGEKRLLKILYNPVLNIILIIVTFGSFFFSYIPVKTLYGELYAISFGIIILNLATNPKPIINLENRIFNYLGKISYGLYMYHVLAIVISIKLLSLIDVSHWMIQTTLSVLFSVLIASLSYYGLEKKFISLKKKYSKVLSGDNVRDN